MTRLVNFVEAGVDDSAEQPSTLIESLRQVGNKLGIFRAMSKYGPLTASELAE